MDRKHWAVILAATPAAETRMVGWKVPAARQMARVKKMLGDIRSVTNEPVVRYAAKRASTSSVVSTAGGGGAILVGVQ
jgi:hypothetical protein